MNDVVVNIQAIRDLVHSKHEKFMEGCGDLSMEISASHKLLVEISRARLNYILATFVEEGVIDLFENVSPQKSHLEFSLIKNGFENSVGVLTDGSTVVFKDSNFKVSSNLDEPFQVKYDNVWDESFDWVDFSDHLLGYIHTVIYERKKANEARILGNLYRK